MVFRVENVQAKIGCDIFYHNHKMFKILTNENYFSWNDVLSNWALALSPHFTNTYTSNIQLGPSNFETWDNKQTIKKWELKIDWILVRENSISLCRCAATANLPSSYSRIIRNVNGVLKLVLFLRETTQYFDRFYCIRELSNYWV